MLYRVIPAISLLLCISLGSANASVNDVIPGDYEAPSVGVNLLTLYLAKKTMVGPYSEGNKLTNDRVNSLVTAVKLTKTVEIGGYTVCPMIAVPYAATKSGGQELSQMIGEKQSGFADIVVGATGWLINDKQNNQYLAATLLFFPPTGKYDSGQLLNIGENRYKSTLNIGYVQKLSDSFTLELSPEIALYGQNNNSFGRTIEQRPSYALTTNLSYKATPQLTLFGSFVQNGGGENEIDGARQNDASKMQKATAGGYYYTKGGTQILFKYGKEHGVQNGLRTADDFLMRLQWWFM